MRVPPSLQLLFLVASAVVGLHAAGGYMLELQAYPEAVNMSQGTHTVNHVQCGQQSCSLYLKGNTQAYIVPKRHPDFANVKKFTPGTTVGIKPRDYGLDWSLVRYDTLYFEFHQVDQ